MMMKCQAQEPVGKVTASTYDTSGGSRLAEWYSLSLIKVAQTIDPLKIN